MANTFKNAYLDVTSSNTAIYTAPASTTSIVMSLRITNVDGSSADTIILMLLMDHLEIHELLIK